MESTELTKLRATRLAIGFVFDASRKVPQFSQDEMGHVHRLIDAGFTEIGISDRMGWSLERSICAILAASR